MNDQNLLRRLLSATCLAAALALASCATPTPYQPLSASTPQRSGGYSEQQLETDKWRVTFSGNTLTARDTVERYLLYRAAELTLAQGNDWFEIVNRYMEHEVRDEVRPNPFYDPSWDFGGWRPYYHYYAHAYGWRDWYPYSGEPAFDTRRVEQFEARAEIIMRKGTKPAGDGNLFEARDVLEKLGPGILRR
ncbi:MAG: hypothetical protein J7496_01785 [Novosphingobium sp.]|nr:hypothetical protein [Novosphingobium sp.]